MRVSVFSPPSTVVTSSSPRPGDRFRRPLDPLRVGDLAPEHLIAAAEARDFPAAPRMGEDVDVPALRPQRLEIGEGRLRARQDDEIGGGSGAPGAANRNRTPGSARSGSKSSKLEICGRRGTTITRSPDDAAGSRSSATASSAGRRAASAKKGISPNDGQPLIASICAHPVGEQRGVAAELVDQETAHQRRVIGVEHRARADDLRIDAAAVDVADQHDRRVRLARETHIGDIVLAQVDLRRAAGALDQHDVGLGAQDREALHHAAEQLGLPGLILARPRGADDLALHDDLAADLALRLQQHRVHMDAGLDAAGARLQRLRPPDLAAVRRHGGVVGHVLRLERQHLEPALGQCAAEPGDDQATCQRRSRRLGTSGRGRSWRQPRHARACPGHPHPAAAEALAGKRALSPRRGWPGRARP